MRLPIFSSSGEPTPTDIKLRVYTPIGNANTNTVHCSLIDIRHIGKAEEGRYTLDMMAQGLTAYCNEFRCGYPLPKVSTPLSAHGGSNLQSLYIIARCYCSRPPRRHCNGELGLVLFISPPSAYYFYSEKLPFKGAMVFLEDYVLVSEETLFSRKQRIARLVFHEVLHQWMGNLVSIQAWKCVVPTNLSRTISSNLTRFSVGNKTKTDIYG